MLSLVKFVLGPIQFGLGGQVDWIGTNRKITDVYLIIWLSWHPQLASCRDTKSGGKGKSKSSNHCDKFPQLVAQRGQPGWCEVISSRCSLQACHIFPILQDECEQDMWKLLQCFWPKSAVDGICKKNFNDQLYFELSHDGYKVLRGFSSTDIFICFAIRKW